MCMKQGIQAGALVQPRGIGWGGKQEGGSGWWDTCTPVAHSCHCMANVPQYRKVISLQFNILIKKKKKKLKKKNQLRSWHLLPSLHGKQMGKRWKK